MKLFPFRYSTVIKRPDSDKWLEISRFHELSDKEMLESLQANSKLHRGFRCEDQSMVVILRIPENSPYQNHTTVSDIRISLKQLSVEPRHYQIDNDWYLYVFLNDIAPAAEICSQMRYWCILQGLVVSKETIEVFPCDEPLPYPLQGKFIWLNERCQFVIRRDELSLEDALAFFLDDARKVAVNSAQLQESLSKASAFLKSVLEPPEPRSVQKKGELIDLPFESTAFDSASESAGSDEIVSASVVREASVSEAIPESSGLTASQPVELPPDDEVEVVSIADLDFSPEFDGSRLVVFHDPMVGAVHDRPGSDALPLPGTASAQLFLFPQVNQVADEIKLDTASIKSTKPTRKSRKERKQKSANLRAEGDK